MIRKATQSDIAKIAQLVTRFGAEAGFKENLNIVSFTEFWDTMMTSGNGVVFLLNEGEGCIGGLKYIDPLGGELTATETFWFVKPECRGGGIKLYKEFEKWATENGCRKVIMVHLSNMMPEKLKSFYTTLGYKETETHYIKDL
jgi:GNAT superfamily N-acetyltransferase